MVADMYHTRQNIILKCADVILCGYERINEYYTANVTYDKLHWLYSLLSFSKESHLIILLHKT